MLADYQKQLESLTKDIRKTQRYKNLNIPKNTKEHAGDLALKTWDKSTEFIEKTLETWNKSAELKARVATYVTSRHTVNMGF